MKVGIFRNQDGACDYYRAWLPIHTAMKHGDFKYKEIWMANLLYEAAKRTGKFWDAMNSDIYLIQRLAGDRLMKTIRSFMQGCDLKTKIVMDHDDDVFNVSPLSNHYVDYGTEEIKIVNNGNVIHEWKDGENIDIKTNQKRLDEVKTSLEQADLVTVTTDTLAKVFRIYNSNIKVLPNCVDLTQWNRLDIRRKNTDEIRIAWAGGHSHWEDLYMIRDPLIEIGKKYPNVKIIMVGYMPKSMEMTFRPGQVEFHEWVDTITHPYRMAALDIDIAVIPLVNNVFNISKSIIKWLEFSALQIPCVTSYVKPYSDIEDFDDVEKGIFVEDNTKEGWLKGIETLINNKKTRDRISLNAREFVASNYDINMQYKQWVETYKELTCQSLQTQPS